MIVSQIIKTASEKLRISKILNPQLEAEILLSHIIKKSREFLLAHPDFEIKKMDVIRCALYVARRMKGEPIAYITGHKEFYGLDFLVNKNVLIPRPETEMMMDEVLKIIENPKNNVAGKSLSHRHTRAGGNLCLDIKQIPACAGMTEESSCARNKTSSPVIIDIGTGSGCVIISLYKQLLSCGYPRLRSARFFGIDISKPALAVVRKNAKLHGVDKRINFLYGDLLEPILGGRVLCGETLPGQKDGIASNTAAESSAERLCRDRSKIVITANLPYLTPQQVKNSPSIQYEPRLALTAGPDGLKYYRQLFKQIKKLCCLLPRFSAGFGGFSRQMRLKPHEPGLKPGRSALFTILCEIDPSQAAKIKQLIKKELPGASVEIKKDFAGRNRLAVINLI